jgi:hypothetical protein
MTTARAVKNLWRSMVRHHAGLLLLLVSRSGLAAAFACTPRALRPRITVPLVVAMSPVAEQMSVTTTATFLVADDGVIASLESFQQSHAFLISVILAIVGRLIIAEARRQIEQPVMDELGRRTKQSLTPRTQLITAEAWAKLALCVVLGALAVFEPSRYLHTLPRRAVPPCPLTPARRPLETLHCTDLAGDASELVPFLGEFTDVVYAPVEAALLVGLFKSNLIGGLGFIEEILPFTDVVPTFCIGWCLQNLWPTTPLARKLGIEQPADAAK